MDDALAAKGFPATSPWWRAELRRFFTSGKRQFVPRVGRRGGKSSTLCRAAVVIALHGGHVIPPGDVGVVGIVSVSRPEANQRLRTVRAILDALDIEYRPADDGGIALANHPIVFKTFAATLGAVVGGTWVCAICDEVARWRDSDSGVNPATEVLASLRPTMATQPNARIFLSSSPMGEFDAHFDAYEEGETAFQQIAHAPSWVANPSLTEADCNALEPDERIRSREYGAIPQADMEEGLLTALQLDAVTRAGPADDVPRSPDADGVGPVHNYVAAMDPATRGDVWALVVATADEAGRKRVVALRQWQGTRARPLSPNAVLGEVGAVLAAYGLDSVYSDQHSGDALQDLATPHGFAIVVEPWTAQNKLALFEGLKTRVANRALEVPAHPDLRADLLAVRKRITRSGITLELPHLNGRHCDFAPALAIVASKYIAPAASDVVVEVTEEMRREQRRAKVREEQDKPWYQRGNTGSVKWR